MNIEEYSQLLIKTKETINTSSFDTNIYQKLYKTDFVYLVDRFQEEPWFPKWVESFPINFWKDVGKLLKINSWVKVFNNLDYLFADQWLPFATYSMEVATMINKKNKILIADFLNTFKGNAVFDLLLLKNLDNDILNTSTKDNKNYIDLIELIKIVDKGPEKTTNWVCLDRDVDFKNSFFAFVLSKIEELYPTIKRYDETFLIKVNKSLKKIFISSNKSSFNFNNLIITSKSISDEELVEYSIQNKGIENLGKLWLAINNRNNDNDVYGLLMKENDYDKIYERISLFYNNPEINMFNSLIKNIDNQEYIKYNIYLVDPFKFDGLIIDLLFNKRDFNTLKSINQNHPNRIYEYFETKKIGDSPLKTADWEIRKEELYITLNINNKKNQSFNKI